MHGTDRRTDGRSATLHLPDASVLWPLGGKPAIIRSGCWCFALCEDGDVCYFCANMENIFLRKSLHLC